MHPYRITCVYLEQGSTTFSSKNYTKAYETTAAAETGLGMEMAQLHDRGCLEIRGSVLDAADGHLAVSSLRVDGTGTVVAVDGE